MPYRKRYRGGSSSSLAYALIKAQSAAKRIKRTQSYARLGKQVKRAARARGIRGSRFGIATYPEGTWLAEAGANYRDASEAQRQWRRAAGFVGRGSYDFGKAFSRGVNLAGKAYRYGKAAAPYAAMGASMLAPYAPVTAGALATGASMFGSGMYMAGRGSYDLASQNVEGNVTISGSSGTVPDFQSAGDETGAMVITHSEFVGDIYGNEWLNSSTPEQTFVNVNFELNPGLSRSFPFLSQIAVNFEEYEFIQLIYTYTPKISPNLSSTDGQVGSILMYTDYNAGDTPKKSKQAILQAYGSSSGRVIDTVLHGVECDPKKAVGDGQKFTRCRPIKGGDKEDLKDYDHGLFQMAICATPYALSNAVIGELHVSYKVLLRKPRTFSLYGLNIDQDSHYVDNPGSGSSRTIQCGSMNSIGCLVECNTSSGANDPQLVRVTFPASFAGDVSIEFHVGSPTGVIEQFSSAPPQLFGQVTELSTLKNVRTQANEGWAFCTNSGTATTIPVTNSTGFMIGRITLHCEMAVSGFDNIVQWQIPCSNSDGWQMALWIRRMNALEIEVPDTFVDCTTLPVAPV